MKYLDITNQELLKLGQDNNDRYLKNTPFPNIYFDNFFNDDFLSKIVDEFPDMKKKPTQNSTAKWIFSWFTGVHELTVSVDVKVILNLNDRHKVILDCLGKRYWGVYL